MQCATELPMGQSFSLKVGCSWLEKVDALNLFIRTKQWNVSHEPDEEVTFPVFHSACVCLLCPSCCAAFSKCGLHNVKLQLLFSPVLRSHPVSVAQFRPCNFPAACICGTCRRWISVSSSRIIFGWVSGCHSGEHLFASQSRLVLCGPVWSPPAWE